MVVESVLVTKGNFKLPHESVAGFVGAIPRYALDFSLIFCCIDVIGCGYVTDRKWTGSRHERMSMQYD